MTFPQHTRAHADGWAAIIGGQVYRGTCYPELAGSYFFTDYAAGGSRGVIAKASLQPDRTLLVEPVPGTFPANPTSLHEAGHGELYLTTTIGDVYRLEAR
jgi:hypothetical protein